MNSFDSKSCTHLEELLFFYGLSSKTFMFEAKLSLLPWTSCCLWLSCLVYPSTTRSRCGFSYPTWLCMFYTRLAVLVWRSCCFCAANFHVTLDNLIIITNCVAIFIKLDFCYVRFALNWLYLPGRVSVSVLEFSLTGLLLCRFRAWLAVYLPGRVVVSDCLGVSIRF